MTTEAPLRFHPTRTVTVELPKDEMQIRFAPDETIYFVSSSGHCNLDCSYCVIQPVVKHQPSLNYDDLAFVLERTPGKVFFIFSGKGDFFAGYRKDERLLARLLAHDNVGVALDVNGVVIHCFDDLPPEALSRVRHINLTFHYRQLKDHKALQVWKRNALTMLRKADSADFFVNIILSAPERSLWAEALDWYRENLFAEYPKRLILIRDVNIAFGADDEAEVARLQARHADMLQSLRALGFAEAFASFDFVSCQAGQSYFRLWNDGRVDGCSIPGTVQGLGNIKERSFQPRTEPFTCADVRHCDCYHVATAGKMSFHRR